jgi:hypothetical protein
MSKRIPLNGTIEQNFIKANSDLNSHKTAENILDGLPMKGEKERTVRITVDLPASLHTRLKIYCANRNVKAMHLIIYLLDRILP